MKGRVDALPNAIGDPEASARAESLLAETSAALDTYIAAAQAFEDQGCADVEVDVVTCYGPLILAADAIGEVDAARCHGDLRVAPPSNRGHAP